MNTCTASSAITALAVAALAFSGINGQVAGCTR
jgi:hypothetical protein